MLVSGLVRQIWVTYRDKNSHSGKLWGRKQVLTHMAAQAVGTASMPHGYLGLVVYKCLQKNSSGNPIAEKTWVKKDQLDTVEFTWWCLSFSLISLTLYFPAPCTCLPISFYLFLSLSPFISFRIRKLIELISLLN